MGRRVVRILEVSERPPRVTFLLRDGPAKAGRLHYVPVPRGLEHLFTNAKWLKVTIEVVEGEESRS